jgi:hypothetical protein
MQTVLPNILSGEHGILEELLGGECVDVSFMWQPRIFPLFL